MKEILKFSLGNPWKVKLRRAASAADKVDWCLRWIEEDARIERPWYTIGSNTNRNIFTNTNIFKNTNIYTKLIKYKFVVCSIWKQLIKNIEFDIPFCIAFLMFFVTMRSEDVGKLQHHNCCIDCCEGCLGCIICI